MSTTTISTTTIESRSPRAKFGRWLAGGLAVAFGFATLVEGGHMLLGGPAARAQAGHIVPFVLVFNFMAGFAYVVGGAGTLLGRAWAVWIARALAVTTLVVFVAFGVHVLSGNAYESKTAMAMTLRSGFWVAQALVLPRLQ